MNSRRIAGGLLVVFVALIWLLMPAQGVSAPAAPPNAAGEIRIVGLLPPVEVSAKGGTDWIFTQTGQVLKPGYRVRTGTNSHVVLRWPDDSTVRFGELTEVEILPPRAQSAESGLHLFNGIFSFFHPRKRSDLYTISRGAVAGIKGTEFVMRVDTVNNIERTTLYVIDGSVELTNEFGAVSVNNGQEAVANVGQAPELLTAGFNANNILQWCFYYPAVLDLRDLPLAASEQQALAGSLAAYRSGDLLAALAQYPAGRAPATDAERIYYAALLLSVGQGSKTEATLATSPANAQERLARLATALRQLIAAVKRQPTPSSTKALATVDQLSTELLAASYYEQSRALGDASLKTALDLAKRAVTNSPEFSFAWARVAELEFSFGHIREAMDALDRSLALAPRNAEALALKGFLLAARNKPREAIDWFNRAIAVDSGLGNAWLGRGLCRIRKGDANAGREDLLIAAALEPQRSLLRSYLGKAYGDYGDKDRAVHELDLAKRLDSADPTPWLYSALLNEQHNRINEAVRDLEKSQELNNSRQLYRSEFLLDQDRAVRSVNLANIYRDAGMFDLSVREAARAVSLDYGNYSAHLFLANSYNELRDPNRINLRYETPAESEFLVANLLAPVTAGTLSPTISQQEYSRLFERDRFGIVSETEYLSRGAWTQSGAQYGVFGNTGYALDALYRTDPGQRPNNDFEERQLSLQVKQQFTAKDSIYLQALDYHAEGGDLLQYYDQSMANPGVRVKEREDPILVAGYHREWSPGAHSLFLATRLKDHVSLDNPSQTTFFVSNPGGVGIDYVAPESINETLRRDLEIYSFEFQQIWQRSRNSLILGTRLQLGHFDTENLQINDSGAFRLFFPQPAASQSIRSGFERFSAYGYDCFKLAENLMFVAGLSYDRIKFPENRRAAPVSDQETTATRVSPKAGVVWIPLKGAVIRGAYTRSLSGAGPDQSFQLEPSQVAGFNQTFRSIIPESAGGENAGARFETYGISLEQRFRTETYLGISGEILRSTADRILGVFELTDPIFGFTAPSQTPERISYEEQTLLFTLNQLIGKDFSLGARYRLSRAHLNDDFPDFPDTAFFDGGFRPHQSLKATLHELRLSSIYNHSSGFFAEFDGTWYKQSNYGYDPDIPGDDFWQLDIFAGYRFLHRHAELLVGLLNLTDQNYRLNPLTLYNELPRERTFVARLRFNF